MNFTLWALGLAAVAAIVFFGRRKLQRSAEAKSRDRARKKSAAEEAELDRQACLDLGKSLMATLPASRPEGEAKPVATEKAG
jgi:hypothetical protein